LAQEVKLESWSVIQRLLRECSISYVMVGHDMVGAH